MSRGRIPQREFNRRAMIRKRARKLREDLALLDRAGGKCEACSVEGLPLYLWKPPGLVVCSPCLDRLRARHYRAEVA
jgi:hypothetical protein